MAWIPYTPEPGECICGDYHHHKHRAAVGGNKICPECYGWQVWKKANQDQEGEDNE